MASALPGRLQGNIDQQAHQNRGYFINDGALEAGYGIESDDKITLVAFYWDFVPSSLQ
ncbi:hypothetical protein VP1G_11042 [Cytospora mali]|uniref:Uncharacterized protein n=1 Tax=Cytospora mali TaxID=578113 RepID=A0A194V3E6_CYTMA|nr:hypothetical protein VP1G_11042 [Valsa mali var. pyri (nom. inval.)]